jgi:hypothetical protein
MPWLPSTAALAAATSCSAAEIEAAAQCQARAAAAFTGTEHCDALVPVARCWPHCFCVHPLGYRLLSLRDVCLTLPPCGPQELTQAPAAPSSHACRAAPRAVGLMVALTPALALAGAALAAAALGARC